jgi:periplasmic protein TonB
MIALALDEVADLRRWAVSAALVVLAHATIAAAVVGWRGSVEPEEPSGAIVVEIAPLPEGPAMRETELPAGPQQVMSEASPARPQDTAEVQKVETPVEPKPAAETPDLAPAPKPELALPPPARQEITQETMRRQELQLPVPLTTAPPPVVGRNAPAAAVPVQGRPNPRSSNAVPTWSSKIVAQLERHKRYPAEAQSRGEHGVAQIFFTLDRQGRVLESRVLQSSGAAALDAEALALLQRAQPFPVPPAELPGPQVNLTVPIRFNLK